MSERISPHCTIISIRRHGKYGKKNWAKPPLRHSHEMQNSANRGLSPPPIIPNKLIIHRPQCNGMILCLKEHFHIHRQRTPNEAFFHWNPEFLGLGRQIGQKHSGEFGIFSAKLLASIFGMCSKSLVHVFHYLNIISLKTKPLYPHPKYLFGIGLDFGLQRIRNSTIVCP